MLLFHPAILNVVFYYFFKYHLVRSCIRPIYNLLYSSHFIPHWLFMWGNAVEWLACHLIFVIFWFTGI